MKRYAGILFLLWTGILLVVFYVVQKPGLLNAFTGLVDTLWALFVAALLLFNAYGIGTRLLKLIRIESVEAIDHLLLSLGIGLGAQGLLGLFLSVLQLANEKVLLPVQLAFAIVFLLRNDLPTLRAQMSALAAQINLSLSQYPIFTRYALGLPVLFSFLLTLVPPHEAFDALLYHLTLPESILEQGGLYAANNPAFWFPSLTENVYLWALGMGSDRAAQMIHFAWGVISAFLVWYWSVKGWGAEIGRKTVLLLVSIPSLPILASWAYADMALVYYVIATLYALTWYRVKNLSSWLVIAGWMAGYAMGIKYTSFVLPLTCGLLLFFRFPFRKAVFAAVQFSCMALAVALPWYIRNTIFMGNPFYPFVFGGRYWDDFLARWYAESGTGIGWNPLRLVLVPLNTILGIRDVTFFDGRTGPIFLILAPLTVWILLRRARPDSTDHTYPGQVERWSLLSIGSFALISFAFWTLGVINSAALWQARLLFPALIPFAIPTALGWDSLKAYDTSRLRIGFLVNALVMMVITLTIIDQAIFVLQRNPLAVAAGVQSRERYIERVNPSYAALIILMNDLPPEARVYSLFEPRSYDLPRFVQPDPILYNFAHDVHLHRTPEAILQYWKSEQYTHLLVYERGLEFMVHSSQGKLTADTQRILQETLGQLTLIDQSPDKVYTLYKIP